MDPLEAMLRYQIMDRGVNDPAVLEAMRQVPREAFVLPEMRGEAYTDQALPVGRGQTISQPYIVALMTAALSVRPGDRVLEIGTGTGYQTAILARLARWVYTVERIGDLLEEARERLEAMSIRNVSFRTGDGTLGWENEAPFDRILISAAGPGIPEHLLRTQLSEGGIAVLPAGQVAYQELLRIQLRKGRLQSENLGACRFVPLIGKEGWQA